jgi:hypothetical protein
MTQLCHFAIFIIILTNDSLTQLCYFIIILTNPTNATCLSASFYRTDPRRAEVEPNASMPRLHHCQAA